MRLVFIDLETGGLDLAVHPITQIAAIAVDGDLNELASFEAKLQFDMDRADPEALLGNSYHVETWEREAIPEGEAIRRLSGFLSRFADVCMTSKRTGRDYFVAQLVGHNAAAFDGPFLQATYKRLGLFMPAAYSVLCTLQRAQWLFHERKDLDRPESFKLATLCDRFGVKLEGAHDALADVRATVGLYRALVGVDGVASAGVASRDAPISQ